MLLDRTLTMLEAQFGFLSGWISMRRWAGRWQSSARLHPAAPDRNAARRRRWLPALLLAPFLAFFFLRDGRRFLKFVGDAVPNAYFERTLYMVERVDGTARAYFQGLLKLTSSTPSCLTLGLWVIGIPARSSSG